MSRGTLVPLSAGQQALWLHHTLAPESSAYNDADAALFTPGPDADALCRAVDLLVTRHDMLRSRFVRDGDGPVREIAPPGSYGLVRRDVSGLDDDALLALTRELAREPFDLEHGVFRAVLLHRPHDAVLVVAVHHIATDALSQRLVWRELAATYLALASGAEPELPPQRGTFDDYVTNERDMLASPLAAELAAYWRDVADGSQAAAVPPDHPRGSRPGYTGATVVRTLPADLAQRVRETAVATGVTPFAVLTGSLLILLHRYTGQEDLTIGCPTTTRRSRVLRDVVGLLVNTVLLRVRVSRTDTVAQALAAVGHRLTGAMARGTYPFALVNAGRSADGPLVRTTVTMVAAQRADQIPTAGDPPVRLGPHTVQMLDVPHLEGQTDLTVEFTQGPRGFSVALRYDTELYERETFERFADHLLRVVTVACDAPQTRLSRVSLVDADEQSRLFALGSA
ncbi:condensation domain-containing protein [Catellatospora methionotrophica]|uniref:condensation domain-containing protein n=1 Tax=Catellatospora methionotrophica TaxID=121620 RepID=UPI0033EDE26A